MQEKLVIGMEPRVGKSLPAVPGTPRKFFEFRRLGRRRCSEATVSSWQVTVQLISRIKNTGHCHNLFNGAPTPPVPAKRAAKIVSDSYLAFCNAINLRKEMSKFFWWKHSDL